MGRYELTDEQWAHLAPLLPPRSTGRRGRRFHDHRRIINGMLWIDKTGAPCARLRDRLLHRQEESLEVLGPGLCYFRPSSPGFLQRSQFDGARGVPAPPFSSPA